MAGTNKPRQWEGISKDLQLLYVRSRLTGGAPQTFKEHIQVCENVETFRDAAKDAAQALPEPPSNLDLDLDVSDLYDFRTQAVTLPAVPLADDGPLQLGTNAGDSIWRGEWAKAERHLQSVRELGKANTSLVVPAEANVADQEAEIARQALQGEQMASPDEVVLRIAIMQAMHRSRGLQEFLVLGSQKISDLVDQIRCPLDDLVKSSQQAAAAAAGPAAAAGREAGEEPARAGACYMLLGSALLVDTRQAESARQAHHIQEFCRHHLEQRQQLQQAPAAATSAAGTPAAEPSPPQLLNMCSTTFADLTSLQCSHASLGVFCHQGACEHRVAVLDLRMLHPSDPQHRSAYPLLLSGPVRTNGGRCQVCDRAPAVLLVVDDPDAPCSPCQMCAECHEMLGGEEGVTRGTNYRVMPIREY